MKKKLLSILLILTACFAFGGCEFSLIPEIGEGSGSISSTGGSDSGSTGGSDSGSTGGTDSGSTGGTDSGSTGGTESTGRTYTDFTSEEKALFIEWVGEVIPFVPNDEYYVEESEEYQAVNFYTFGNTQEEFNAYRALFAAYTLQETYEDDYGDTWYVYVKGNLVVELSYYESKGEKVLDVYAYLESDDTDGGSGGSGETDAVKVLLESAYALGKGESLSGTHTLTGVVTHVEKRDQGDVCLTITATGYEQYPMYCFWLQDAAFLQVGDTVTVTGTVKNYKGTIEFDHPTLVSYQTGGGSGEDGNTGGGSGDSGNTGGGSEIELITNHGKGLPQSTNGVYAVDFTKATNVKDVTDQGYYLDGCPTVGSPAVLVVPVEFSDATAASKGYTTAKIKAAFCGEQGATDYYSVKQYYTLSSYGKLNLDITVLDEWFRPKNNSSYYQNATYDYYGDEVAIGDQLIIDEVLAYLAPTMDLTKFDSDKNGIIDAIVLINTLPINSESDFHWAYRYWNIYTDDEGYYYEYDGVSANDYLWASYAFMHEGEDGEFTATNALNTYTYIHEFGHVLGADDYYDTAYEGSPMGGNDIMDSTLGDHNAYSKFNYGWLTSSRLVVAEESVTLTLDAFSKNGDTIIIANDWDETLGVYQEYFILVYYTNDGLHTGKGGYFDEEGVVVYHINASLYKEEMDGTTYYDVYNNNTSASDPDGYGTEENLIEFVLSANGGYVFKAGDSLSANTKTSTGEKIAYVFTVVSVGESVTLSLTRVKQQ